MNWSDEITLVTETKETDDEGYRKTARTRRRIVFANVVSARRSEFYAAKQAGTNIAITFEVMGADYRGERIVEYTHPNTRKKTRYTVERDYTANGEKYELNCSIEAAPNTVGRVRTNT